MKYFFAFIILIAIPASGQKHTILVEYAGEYFGDGKTPFRFQQLLFPQLAYQCQLSRFGVRFDIGWYHRSTMVPQVVNQDVQYIANREHYGFGLSIFRKIIQSNNYYFAPQVGLLYQHNANDFYYLGAWGTSHGWLEGKTDYNEEKYRFGISIGTHAQYRIWNRIVFQATPTLNLYAPGIDQSGKGWRYKNMPLQRTSFILKLGIGYAFGKEKRR